MVEKSIVLHILMEESFPKTDKSKSAKVLFGKIEKLTEILWILVCAKIVTVSSPFQV
jgi:hypothetical protein